MANDRLVKLTEAYQAEERENVNTKKKIIWFLKNKWSPLESELLRVKLVQRNSGLGRSRQLHVV